MSDSAEYESDSPQNATSEMTEEDWQDIAESEFHDFTESSMGTKIGFVFEHPELGLHGFEYIKKDGHIKPVSFEVSD